MEAGSGELEMDLEEPPEEVVDEMLVEVRHPPLPVEEGDPHARGDDEEEEGDGGDAPARQVPAAGRRAGREGDQGDGEDGDGPFRQKRPRREEGEEGREQGVRGLFRPPQHLRAEAGQRARAEGADADVEQNAVAVVPEARHREKDEEREPRGAFPAPAAGEEERRGEHHGPQEHGDGAGDRRRYAPGGGVGQGDEVVVEGRLLEEREAAEAGHDPVPLPQRLPRDLRLSRLVGAEEPALVDAGRHRRGHRRQEKNGTRMSHPGSPRPGGSIGAVGRNPMIRRGGGAAQDGSWAALPDLSAVLDRTARPVRPRGIRV